MHMRLSFWLIFGCLTLFGCDAADRQPHGMPTSAKFAAGKQDSVVADEKLFALHPAGRVCTTMHVTERWTLAGDEQHSAGVFKVAEGRRVDQLRISLGNFSRDDGIAITEVVAARNRKIEIGSDGVSGIVVVSELKGTPESVWISFDASSQAERAAALALALSVVPCHLQR
jgi:hypothetical protein